MGDLQGRKVFKVFNQDFIVDERYTVTKELGQGAYGIVWFVQFTSESREYNLVEHFVVIEEDGELMKPLANNKDIVPPQTLRPMKAWLLKR